MWHEAKGHDKHWLKALKEDQEEHKKEHEETLEHMRSKKMHTHFLLHE